MTRELSEVIGARGERIFELAITNYEDFKRPLFRPNFLGDKWPAIDYYVELLGVKDSRPVMFVQVKSTGQPLPTTKTELSISLPKDKSLSLFKVPGPTYLVGVHEPSRRTFILSINRKPVGGTYSIPLQYELTPTNLKLLYDEVKEFWRIHPKKPFKSAFMT